MEDALKICDVTQFYAPRSGGVKRYIHAKIAYLQEHSPGGQHVLIVPGAETAQTTNGISRIYTITSPLVSRKTGYRALLNLRAVAEIIERERPDIIESADPYQLGWKLAAIARAQRLPAVAFYHSDFAEAYLRPRLSLLGERICATALRATQRYVETLYNRFAATFVPSRDLAIRLRDWGVRDVRIIGLGVDTAVFNTAASDARATRTELGLNDETRLLIYGGRLAPEKNTATLCRAFEALSQRRPGAFHLLVVGDGQQRSLVDKIRARTGAVTWLPYCDDPLRLAQLYRAADLFVHPGTEETFGLVALESQACGTPVVGIRGSAMDHIILHDQTAWSQSPTPDALANAIEEFAARDLQGFGQAAASAVAQQYSWRQVFDRLFSVYREVCTEYMQRAAK